MIYLYSRRRAATGDLARGFQDLDQEVQRIISMEQPLRVGDLVVCWGYSWTGEALGVTFLNAHNPGGKLTQNRTMHRAGVPVVELSRAPGREAPGRWVPRVLGHRGGLDLMRPPRAPDFFTKYETLSAEFRAHVFQRPDGEFVVSRLGRKVPGPDGTGEPAWVRSWYNGWRLAYNGARKGEVPNSIRETAKAAVRALGLNFGAVDIGLKDRDRQPLVLEVNRAPGLSSGTPAVYARKIMEWRS